jgi:myo-inositol-1(or 4)-monophosphatase
LTAKPTFIVDPIDGTTNFVHGHSYVSVSLGLAINYTPYVGVVYSPFMGLLYTAIRGRGAHLTTCFPGRPTAEPRTVQKLPLRPPEKLTGVQNAQLCVEWGSDRGGNDMRVKTATFARLVRAKEEQGAMAHSLRSYGSAALNLCGVAAGSIDAYWEAGCWAWDVCAGWCILVEAGGCLVGANPGEMNAGLETRRYFAIRGDGEAGGQEVDGVGDGQETMRVSQGQKAFIDEFWGYVEGAFEVGQ